MTNAAEGFRTAIGAAGITPPDTLEADGKLHRFSSNGKRGDDAGWYVFHSDGIAAGTFGDWRTGISETWREDVGRKLAPMEEQAYRERIAAAQQARDAEAAKREAAARQAADAILGQAQPCPSDHPYLVKKKIQPHDAQICDGNLLAQHGIRFADDFPVGPVLIVPLVDINSEKKACLAGLQLIDSRGEKRFLPGCSMAGKFYILKGDKNKPQRLICEGFATAATLREATGLTVFAAMNAGNLCRVAKSVRRAVPDKVLLIVADDDAETQTKIGKNPGIEAATETAAAVGGLVVVPDFGQDRPAGLSDFNDLAIARGIQEVKRQIESTDRELLNIRVGARIVRASDVTPESVAWLWPGKFALGKVSMIAGSPGLGKSQVSCSVAAIVSRGNRWPVDRSSASQGTIVFLSAEDDPADTIIPRLMAAGADLDRVRLLEAIRSSRGGGERAFDLGRDLGNLERLLRELGDVRMIVIDPISAYLGKTDSHSNAEIRALLHPLAKLAGEHRAAVVGITHLNKGGQQTRDPTQSALQRVTGSIAFTAAARAVWMVIRDPDDPKRRLFLPAKNNLAEDQSGLAFKVVGRQLENGIRTSCVEWEKASISINLDEFLSPGADDIKRSRSTLVEASEFLGEALAGGPVTVADLKADARNAGRGWRTVEDAKASLGVISRSTGFGKDKVWYWGFPEDLDRKLPTVGRSLRPTVKPAPEARSSLDRTLRPKEGDLRPKAEKTEAPAGADEV